MLAVHILLAFLSVASGTNLPERDGCTLGPTYWCSGVTHAKECGAIEHCLTVWKKDLQEVPEDKEPCHICNGIVTGIKTLLDSKTEEDIQTAALQTCKVFHEEQKAQEICETVVVLFLPEIIQMLEVDLNSAVICSKIEVCSSNKISLVPVVKHVAEKVSNNGCSTCKLGASFLLSYLAQKNTQQEIVTLFTNDICSKLPMGIQGFCRIFAVTNFRQLLKEHNDLINPAEVCGFAGYCPKAVDAKFLMRELIFKISRNTFKTNTEFEAEFPEIFVELQQPNVQKSVILFLQAEICPHFGSLKDACTQTVKEHIPQAIDIIIKNKENHREQSVKCTICTVVVKEVNKLIGSDRSESAIQKALEKVCSKVPFLVRKECTVFVDKYTHKLVQLLVKVVSPQLVCKGIGLCASQPEHSSAFYKVLHKSNKKSYGVSLLASKASVRQISPMMKPIDCVGSPLNWCTNYEVAVRCDVVNYCSEKVWRRKDGRL